jgi:hypothetical protein
MIVKLRLRPYDRAQLFALECHDLLISICSALSVLETYTPMPFNPPGFDKAKSIDQV